MKKKIVLGAILLCTCFLSGCGESGKKMDQSENAVEEFESAVDESESTAEESGINIMENTGDYGYAAKYETLYSGSDSMFSCICFQEQFLYYVKRTNMPIEQGNSYSLCRRELKEGSQEEVLFHRESSKGFDYLPVSCYVYPDGRVILILSKLGSGQESGILHVLEADGREIYTVDITDAFYREFSSIFVSKCVTDPDGKIYLVNQDKIVVYGAQGNLLFSLPVKGDYLKTIGTDGDGSVYAVQQVQDTGIEVSRVDVKEQDYADACREFAWQVRGECLTAGGQNIVLLDAETGLIAFEPDTQRSVQLLKWEDFGVYPGNLREVYMPDPEHVYLLFQEIEKDNYEYRLISLTRKLKSEIPPRPVITIGTANCSWLLESAVDIFNEENPEYQVEILDYTKEFRERNSETPMEDAVQKLRMDILTGNAPDIIDFTEVGLDYGQLMQKGYLEDLYPYIDSSESLSREALVQPLLEVYTMDGELPCLPRGVYIDTLAVKKSLTGDKKSWTPEEFIAFAQRQPDGVQVTNHATRDRILYDCIKFDLEHYIDRETGECFFDSEEFQRILEFAGSFPDTLPEEEEVYSRAELLADNRLLVSEVHFSGMKEIKEWNADFNGDLTFIGYPVHEGQGGSAFVGLEALGISSQSEHKEVAWKFIQSLFVEEMQNIPPAWGIPMLQSVYDEKQEAARKKYYEVDREGNEVEVTYEFRVFYDGTYAVTEAEEEQFEELMRNTRKAYSNVFGIGSEIYEIIYEEAEPYFTGQKSLEEVTETIQRRVQLYLRENM